MRTVHPMPGETAEQAAIKILKAKGALRQKGRHLAAKK